MKVDALKALIAAASAGRSLAIDEQRAAFEEAFDLVVDFLADVKRIADATTLSAECADSVASRRYLDVRTTSGD